MTKTENKFGPGMKLLFLLIIVGGIAALLRYIFGIGYISNLSAATRGESGSGLTSSRVLRWRQEGSQPPRQCTSSAGRSTTRWSDRRS